MAQRGFGLTGSINVKSVRTSQARVTLVLAKVAKTAGAETRRCYASVPCAPCWKLHGAELATLRHPHLFGHFQRRCSARFEGAEDHPLSNSNSNSNSKSKIFSASASDSRGTPKRFHRPGEWMAPAVLLGTSMNLGRRSSVAVPCGSCRAVVAFAKTKVTRVQGAKALDLSLGAKSQAQIGPTP